MQDKIVLSISQFNQALEPAERDIFGNNIEQRDNLLLLNLIKTMRLLCGLKISDAFISYLINELKVDSPKSTFNSLGEIKGSHPSELEEMVSDIFQTRLLRIEDAQKGHYLRKKNGIFHTPYGVASLIASEALKPIQDKIRLISQGKLTNTDKKQVYEEFVNLKVVDPACGTGIILSAIIDSLLSINRKLRRELKGISGYLPDQEFLNHIVCNNIFGIDINEKACAITRAILTAKYLSEQKDLTRNVKCGNSLMPDGLFADLGFSFSNEFPDVFNTKKGFDILVMNPPYERLKTDRSNFSKIGNGDIVYDAEREETAAFVQNVRRSGIFPLAGKGVLDLYKLFIDRAIQITNDTGTISFIVPLSLLGDVSCSNLRKYIFNNSEITNVFCIPENARVFPKVSQAFCIMGFQKGKQPKPFSLYEKVNCVAPLRYWRKVEISQADISAICPETLSVPICDKGGWRILRKIHKYPRLHQIGDIINLRGELDLTLGKRYISVDSSKEILIRGSMVKAYYLDTSEPEVRGYVDIEKLIRDRILGSKSMYVNSTRLVGQQIANMGLKRRLRFALCEKGVLANSCNFIGLRGQADRNYLYFLLGLLNSLLLNWRFKLTSTNNHVNNYELDDLPIVNIETANKVLAKKIAVLAEEQCRGFSEERQNLIDTFVFSVYKLDDRDIKYILEHEGYDKDEIKRLAKFQYEKNSL